MEERFNRYIKCLEQKNVSPEELAAVKAELHKTFASLSQEDQAYAELLLGDISRGDIVLEPGMTLADYIARYKTRALEREIDFAVQAFGLDRTLLAAILASGRVTDANLNEYGRFDRLLRSVDIPKAKAYLEEVLGTPLGAMGFQTKISAILAEFLLSGGKGEKIPRPPPAS